MADVTYVCTDWRQARFAVQGDVRDIAAKIASAAAGATPRRTGRMAASYRLVPGNDPGTTLVTNDAPYARYVEYGTRHQPAHAPLGRALAAGG